MRRKINLSKKHEKDTAAFDTALQGFIFSLVLSAIGLYIWEAIWFLAPAVFFFLYGVYCYVRINYNQRCANEGNYHKMLP